ncbi:hypothetical protein Tco_1132075 [Tanacetum coccineum]|uniref:Uncharacterized protein n=1 Tax=Tanacetum coccineum TaxID=301880 RepID=A0ABQ5JBH1_9ASTR
MDIGCPKWRHASRETYSQKASGFDQLWKYKEMSVCTLWIEFRVTILSRSVMDEAHASRCMLKDFWRAATAEILRENGDRSHGIFSLNFPMEWNSGDDQLRLRWLIYLMVLADATESVRDAIGFEYD